MLILGKVLNSLMTMGFLFSRLLWFLTLSPPQSTLCRREAGRKKKKARGARALLDLTWPAFCGTSWQRFVLRSPISPSSVHIGVSIESCCWYFSNGWRKAIRKIKGETLGASDIFNFKKNVSRKKLLTWSWSKHFGGVSETKLAGTRWPETHWPRRIMRPSDKATADSRSVQSFAIVKTNSSLLRTVCFVPGERQPLHFLKIHPEMILRSLFCFKDTKTEVY